MQSLVLAEGIKGWVGAGAGYVAMMDEYEKDTWEEKE